MRYVVTVGGVDGETSVQMQTPSKEAVKKFLEKMDHEGSDVHLVITTDTPEEVYELVGE